MLLWNFIRNGSRLQTLMGRFWLFLTCVCQYQEFPEAQDAGRESKISTAVTTPAWDFNPAGVVKRGEGRYFRKLKAFLTMPARMFILLILSNKK